VDLIEVGGKMTRKLKTIITGGKTRMSLFAQKFFKIAEREK